MTYLSARKGSNNLEINQRSSLLTMAKIKSIEYFRVPPRWLFVKVTDADNSFGWGEATLEGHSEAVEGMLEGIKATILGFEAG